MRSEAEAFARALDDGSAATVGPQAPVVAALTAARAELDDRVRADPAFRERLRADLLAEARRSAALPPGPAAPAPVLLSSRRELRAARAAAQRRWLRPVLAACASLVLVVAALAGISLASRHALPGDTLYGAKRATEALQLRTEDGELAQGIARLHLAEKRLSEAQQLAADDRGQALGAGSGILASGSDASLIRSTLAAMDDETRTGSGMVLTVALTSGQSTPLDVLAGWSGQQADRLRAARQVLPAAAQDRLDASLTLIDGLGTRTRALLDADTGAGPH